MYDAMKKKGYVRLVTSLGPLSIELHCDKVGGPTRHAGSRAPAQCRRAPDDGRMALHVQGVRVVRRP